MSQFRSCIVIPCFNHSAEFERFLPNLLAFTGTTKIFVIDDGSVPAEAEKLREICGNAENITLFRCEKNGGKGVALKASFELALKENFTHALQIDADGQHDPAEIPRFFEFAKSVPANAIFGAPIYGNDAPRSRVIGRKITNFWLAIETFSTKMRDGLCGFRVYPLAAIQPLLPRGFWRQRMGFDVQILVELYWSGTDIDFHPIRVFYPANGRSHLTPFRGNLAISLAHTQLCLKLIWRLLHFKFRDKN